MDQLFDKTIVRCEKLTEEEIEEVAQEIRRFQKSDSSDFGRLDSLLMILQRVCFMNEKLVYKYKSLVAEFLVYPEDTVIAGTALETLFHLWKLYDEYLDYVKGYMREVECYNNEFLRCRAITIAGCYVSETGDKDCLQLLSDIMQDEREEENIRNVACHAFMRGMQYNSHEVSQEAKLKFLQKRKSLGL